MGSMPNLARRTPPLRPRRLASALARDSRGNSILEFALVVAPFFALLIGVLATSLLFFAQQGLETAAESVQRKVMTGQVQQGGMTQEQFRQLACAGLPPFLKCANLMVDVQTAASFSDVDTTNPTITYDSNGNATNSWAYSMGGAGDIVIMRLLYIFPLPIGPLGMNYSNAGSGKRLLVATEVFKSETYS